MLKASRPLLVKNMEVFTVDSFSSSPFSGNPAGVCILETGREPLSDDLMQKVAAEMNLSETAFVQPLAMHRHKHSNA